MAKLECNHRTDGKSGQTGRSGIGLAAHPWTRRKIPRRVETTARDGNRFGHLTTMVVLRQSCSAPSAAARRAGIIRRLGAGSAARAAWVANARGGEQAMPLAAPGREKQASYDPRPASHARERVLSPPPDAPLPSINFLRSALASAAIRGSIYATREATGHGVLDSRQLEKARGGEIYDRDLRVSSPSHLPPPAAKREGVTWFFFFC